MAQEIEFTVWEFVRVMVELEEQIADGRKSALYDHWQNAWAELDGRLTKLGKKNADAFADLMMNQTVSLELPRAKDKTELLKVIDVVVRKLSKSLKAKEGDKAHRESLRFEVAELNDLRARLATESSR